jgi:hypothetical protein
LQLKDPDEQARAKAVNYAGMRAAINNIGYVSQRRIAIISGVPETVHSVLYSKSGVANAR